MKALGKVWLAKGLFALTYVNIASVNVSVGDYLGIFFFPTLSTEIDQGGTLSNVGQTINSILPNKKAYFTVQCIN